MSKELTKLSDLIDEISMGPFGSDIKLDNFISSGVPVLNGSNLSGIKLIEEQFRFVTKEKAKSYKKSIAGRGDIVITHRGTLGQISFIPDNSKYDQYVISQSQFRVRLKRDLVDPSFFVYYFHTSVGQKRLLANKCHVGVPALAQATTNFRLINIPLPSLPAQQKIASVLSALDSKIELNNRINAELEAMAKTLYDYWFVQFDFPNEEGKPYKSGGGKMVWNEALKRQIPEGWDMKQLVEVASLIYRGISPKYIEDGGICVLNQKCIRNKSINFTLGRRHNHLLKNATSRLIKFGDILVNSTGVGTLGRLAMVIRLDEPHTSVDSHVTIVRIDNKKGSQLFVGYSLTEKQSEIEHLGEGSTGQTELSRDNLGNLKLILPPNHLQVAFENFIKPQFQKIANNEKENQELIKLRDWLLPMLMNGQVKVADDEEEDLSMAAEPEGKYSGTKI